MATGHHQRWTPNYANQKRNQPLGHYREQQRVAGRLFWGHFPEAIAILNAEGCGMTLTGCLVDWPSLRLCKSVGDFRAPRKMGSLRTNSRHISLTWNSGPYASTRFDWSYIKIFSTPEYLYRGHRWWLINFERMLAVTYLTTDRADKTTGFLKYDLCWLG